MPSSSAQVYSREEIELDLQITATMVSKSRNDEVFNKKNLEATYLRYKPENYDINPPPLGRPIRIYADGVFDLFHLGFVFRLSPSAYLISRVLDICGNWNRLKRHSLRHI